MAKLTTQNTKKSFDEKLKQADYQVRLRIRRDELGLTQGELAKKVGVSTTTIQSYESGTLPKGKYIISLSDALKCSIDWLLAGRGNVEQSTTDNPKPYDININLLREIIEGIEESLDQQNVELSSDKKAQLITLLYEHFFETNKEVNKGTVTRYLKLVA